MSKLLQGLKRGIITENPILVLVLGMCPTLATTSSMATAVGMGVAATVVLICSNIFISLLRKIIPDKVRIAAYIVVIATFVTIVEMIVHAFFPELYDMLGVYLALITVNCIILGRAEMYASKNPVLLSALDGVGMGVGFTAAMLLMGMIRELLGTGCLFGVSVLPSFYTPITVFILPAGGFFVFGLLISLANKLQGEKKAKGKIGCAACPLSKTCAKAEQSEEEAEGCGNA